MNGYIEPVVYFVCTRPELTNPQRPLNYHLIAPYTGCPNPDGYERREARTLPEARTLERTLVQQEREGWEQEAEVEQAKFAQVSQEIRDRLYARMTSSTTDEWEREFIRLYLQLRDERKAEKYAAIYQQRHAYLHALHFDTPKGRGVDEETFSVDRIAVT